MDKKEKSTQKQKVLQVLKSGKSITQINLRRYLALLNNSTYNEQSDVVDAIAELGIANLPTRICELRKEGYNIVSKKVDIKGRFNENTFYFEYKLGD